MINPEIGRGVLYPGAQAEISSLTRIEPAAGLARLVEFYWLVRWELPSAAAYETKVLSHPNVHLVFEEPRPLLYGVDRGLFVRRLEGAGRVLGVKFRPGCFRPFAAGPVLRFADRRVPAAEVLGPAVDEVGRAVLAADDDGAIVRPVDAFLLSLLPAPDPIAEQIAVMVERIAAEPELVRVDQVADRFGISVRRLQRLFAEYVGASPKWVLRRSRLHEAATRADSGDGVDWAALAAELGYADQAHLTRDFTAVVGEPPTRYASGGGRR
ncbi:DUF6597 domain-containing transcriptional factor [Kitasatospora sp. NPDC050543]|uniref:DUF6597 domain-containing transcriptional factor n=1 Tax=Kitasatospora sp. NPDC050543 TaxID=3364054 RepID=UPI0037BB20A0